MNVEETVAGVRVSHSVLCTSSKRYDSLCMTFPYTKVTGHLNLADHEFVDTSCPPDQPPFVDPLAMNSMTPSKDRALKLAIHRVKQDASSVSVEQSNTFEEGSTGLTQEISPGQSIQLAFSSIVH